MAGSLEAQRKKHAQRMRAVREKNPEKRLEENNKRRYRDYKKTCQNTDDVPLEYDDWLAENPPKKKR